MRWIRGIFENSSLHEVKEDIVDIFQAEVEDVNFTISEVKSSKIEGIWFEVEKKTNSDWGLVDVKFKISELSDFIERLFSYSEQTGRSIQIYPVGSFKLVYLTRQNWTGYLKQEVDNLNIMINPETQGIMRHLKSVSESFREERIKEDVEDIFQAEVESPYFELTDASSRVEPGWFAFKVQKQEDRSFPAVEPFQILELKDFIERILNYAEKSPCDILVYFPLPLGVEYVKKEDLVDEKYGFFSNYLIHTLMIKIRAFE